MYMDKYKALAFQSPLGKILTLKVEANWNDWINLLERNNIPQTFKRLGYTKDAACCPEDIYAAAIWGYGVSNWLEGQKDPADFCAKNFFKGNRKADSGQLRYVNNTPIWFYLLDQWLESLCRDILSLTEKI